MIYIEPRGAFGRQARYKDGPLPIRRCLDPVNAVPVQLRAAEHRSNWLQYLFAQGVQDVMLDRRLPAWAATYCSAKERPNTQVVRLSGGGYLVVALYRSKCSTAAVEPVGPQIWRVARSLDAIAQPLDLNRNLEQARQQLTQRIGLPLTREHGDTVNALRLAGSTTRGGLRKWLQAATSEADARLDCVLMRLLLSGGIAIDLTTGRYGDETLIRYGARGVGYSPPLPLQGLSLREAA
jgi:hypothetical protein